MRRERGDTRMFERTKRNGLIGRLLKQTGLQPGQGTFIVAPIAMANYPKGAEIPTLPPVIDQQAISKATERFVDGREGTLDDLYQTIWGMTRTTYDHKIDAQLRA